MGSGEKVTPMMTGSVGKTYVPDVAKSLCRGSGGSKGYFRILCEYGSKLRHIMANN